MNNGKYTFRDAEDCRKRVVDMASDLAMFIEAHDEESVFVIVQAMIMNLSSAARVLYGDNFSGELTRQIKYFEKRIDEIDL